MTIQVWRDRHGKARVRVHTVWGKTEWRIYIEVKQVGIAPGTPFAFWQSLGPVVSVPPGTSRAALRDIRRHTAELYMLEHGGNYVLRGTV